MANYVPIYDKPGEPPIVMCKADIVSGTSEQINAAIPDYAPGTIISSPGYELMKQKGLDGSWVTL